VLLSTLIAFVCVYALFMTSFLVFSARVIRRGPQAAPAQAEASGSLKPALKSIMGGAPALLPTPAE
jgi:cytochrome d ubiquinol oxidase subunit I